jgi:endo-1,3-1,4-beta-glycanase ExoK
VVPVGAIGAFFIVVPTAAVTIYGNYGPGAGSTQHVAIAVAAPTPTPAPAPVPTPAPAPGPVPTFSDNFNEQGLDLTKWIVSNWTSKNYAGAGSDVTFSPNNISVSQGMLRLELDQPTASTSVGAELQSKQTFGYGTYEFRARMSSTSPIYDGAGKTLSGSDSAMFCFINNSQTEIDIEFCGNTPGIINLTNWLTLGAHTSDEPAIAGLDQGFHDYKIVWKAGMIQWYIDGTLVATHTTNVPSVPAYIMLNFWGTNDPQWGGLATPGVSRYMYVSLVQFTPDH